jgi:hypothetical protein
MAQNQLTDIALEHACAREKDRVVLRVLVANQDLTDTQALHVAARLKPDDVRYWLTSRRYPAGIEAALLERVGPGLIEHYQIGHYLARSPHQFNQDALAALLDNAPDPDQQAIIARGLLANPNTGGSLLVRARDTVNAHTDQRTLSPNEIAKMLNRVTTHNYAVTRPWNQLDMPAELELLTETVAPGSIPWNTVGRYLTGPHSRLRNRMRRQEAHDLGTGKRNLDTPLDARVSSYAAVSAARLIETQLDAHGITVWETAITLLTDGYPGSGRELVATAVSLTRDSGRDATESAPVATATPTRRAVRPGARGTRARGVS